MKIRIEAPSGKVCRMVDVEPGTPGRDEDGCAVIRVLDDNDPDAPLAIDEDGRLWSYECDALLVIALDVESEGVVRGEALREWTDGRRFEVVEIVEEGGEYGRAKVGDRGVCPDEDYRCADQDENGEPAKLWFRSDDGECGWVTALRPLDD